MAFRPLSLLLIYPYLVLACLDPRQVQGQCEQCTPSQIFFEGRCLEKLTGCLVHQIGPICSQCKTGYILSEGRCQLVGQKQLENNFQIPRYQTVSFINAESLGRKLEREGFLNYFPMKYKDALRQTSQKSQQFIESQKGTYIIVLYQGNNRILFQGIGLVKKSMQFIEVSFKQVQGNFTAAQTFKNIVTNQKISPTVLLGIQVTSSGYIFDFINHQIITRVNVNQNRRYKQEITLEQMARIKIQKKHFELKRYTNKQVKINSINNYIIFHYGSDFSVSVAFKNFQFTVNTPVQLEIPETINKDYLVRGRYFEFNELSNPIYLSSLNYILQEFPELKYYRVRNVKAQIVAGMNFLIFFDNQTANEYLFKIYAAFDGTLKILKGYHNQQLVYTSNYDYNIQSRFFQGYDKVVEQLHIEELPLIDSVFWKQNIEGIFFKITYNQNQILIFKLSKKLNDPQLVMYSIGGFNRLGLTDMLSSELKSIELQDILEFLSVVPQNVKNYRVESPLHSLQLVMFNGTYNIVVEDTEKGLKIFESSQVSQVNCYELTFADFQRQDIKSIDIFLHQTYQLQNMALTIVQKQLRADSTEYMFLYVNNKKKQAQFIMKVIDNKIEIIKGRILNHGYESLEKQHKHLLEKIKDKDHSLLFAQANQTNIQGFYSTGTETKQIIYDIIHQTVNMQVLHQMNYLTIPKGFIWSKIVVPEIQGNSISAYDKQLVFTAMKAVSNKYGSYVRNPILKFAQKETKNGRHNLLMLIKTSLGYLQILASAQLTYQKVTLIDLELTQYKDSDFSKCKRFDSNGECIECMAIQVSYQGSCFIKIEGCLIQAANLCLKCEQKYIQSGYKCFRECETILL